MAVKVVWPTAELERFGVKVPEDLRRFGAEFIQELNNAVVEATPVKTGHLRASWFGGLNHEPEGAAGSGSAGQMNAAAAGFQLGDTYYAVNRAAYAAFVEFGTRRMAPRAFVRRTLANVQSIAAMVAARIKRS